LFRYLAVCVVAGVSAAEGVALAADLPASFCPLERAPVLDWLRLAKGDDCPLDEDGNGLDDRVETALARCFVPEFAFDSRENSVRPDEPHVVFSADPIGPRLIRLHFAVLFERDGGYLLGTEFPCLSDEHNGDSEAVTVDVVWLERDRRWYGAPLALHTLGPDNLDERSELGGAAGNGGTGTHPRLYPTAGKHHWLHAPADLSYACSCGPLGKCGQVRDRADGKGPRVIPTSLRHAPRFAFRSDAGAGAATPVPVRPLAPFDTAAREFQNACDARTRGRSARAVRSLGSNDLRDLGYPGEHVFGICFRGGLGGPCRATVSVGEALAWDNPPGKSAGRPESSAGKIIATLLGLASLPATEPPAQVLGWSSSRLYVVPDGGLGWTKVFGGTTESSTVR
jgi:hypothetical protein